MYTDKAPSLKRFAGTHLEADEYHQAMKDPETVIIDVRNAYESAIGNFQPPEGGAKLIDPKMRNSIEFPKWLNSKETKEQLNGKKVLMYCTGGIRCERATALLNQISTVSDDIKPKGVYHCRGGIERYVKTFPSGGFWKGKNYLFDRRMEQTPSVKADADVEGDVASKCCLCRIKWTVYRGQFNCNRSLCRVPVIVCDTCTAAATDKPETLVCELCREGYRAPTEMPDLVSMKRKADAIVDATGSGSTSSTDQAEVSSIKKKPKVYYKDRLFLRRLPLTITASKIKDEIGSDLVKHVHWLKDKENGYFYGSCMLQTSSEQAMNDILEKASYKGGNSASDGCIKMAKKKIKVAPVFMKKDGDLFMNFAEKEFPPVGH